MQGNSALAGASGATVGEFIAQQMYPGVKRADLTEEQKQTISSLSTLAAGLAGGLTGDSSANAEAGAQAGKNAVENNALSVPGNKSRSQEMAQCKGSSACENGVIDKYKKINAEQHESVVGCKGAQDCVNKANEVSQLQADYANRANELLEKSRNNGGLSPAEQDELAILQVTSIQLEADRTAAIHNALISGDSPEAKQLAINSLVQTAGMSAAGIAAGVGKAGAKGTETGQSSTIVPGGGLAAHEKAGGHLIARHVGQTDAQLSARLTSDPEVRIVSTFNDRTAAESAISNAIGANQNAIDSFMNSNKNQIVIKYSSPTVIGSSMTRGSSSSQPASNVTVVIRKDPTMPDGYRIHTGYPTP